jgi:recombination protein RecT
MTNTQLTLKEFLQGETAVEQFKSYLGADEAKIRKFSTSVMIQVMGNEQLKKCSNESILTACIDAINLGLAVDNRNLAYLVPYGGKAQLQIGYKGYVYKVREAYPDADFKVGLVYEGDQFGEIETVNGIDTFKHVVANPFENDMKKLQGAYCYITYFQNGERKGRLTILNIEEIKQLKSISKGNFWAKWERAMIEKSVTRKACKLNFTGLVDAIDEYDNSNFEFGDDSAKPQKANVSSLSQKMIAAKTTPIVESTAELLDDEIPEHVEVKSEPKKQAAANVKSDGELF